MNYTLHALFFIGASIDRDQLNIGASATAKWFSNAPATRMEWLQNGIVLSDMSTQQLNLVFSPVNDSIHNQVYIYLQGHTLDKGEHKQSRTSLQQSIVTNTEFLAL